MKDSTIPLELRQLDQWVCAYRDSKIPMKSWEDEAASSTNPRTWSDFNTAYESVRNGWYDYIGFVFADNGLVGIDIDAGFDLDGFMSPLAADIINACQSYTEVSRSGRGFHIIVRGDLPFKGKNNLRGVEIYKQSRFFIITGDTMLYQNVIANQKAIDYVVDKYFPDVRQTTQSAVHNPRIYTPIWGNPVENGRIKIRPQYTQISTGNRNLCLTSLAGQLHSQGYTKQQIYDELMRCNKEACVPPLSKHEVQSICKSVTRYKR